MLTICKKAILEILMRKNPNETDTIVRNLLKQNIDSESEEKIDSNFQIYFEAAFERRSFKGPSILHLY